MKWHSFSLMLAGLAMIVANSCTQSPVGPTVTTTFWELDGNGYVQFSTNDPKYYEYYFEVYYDQEYQAAPMTSAVIAVVKKMSGALNIGFGMLFCFTDFGNFFYVLITADGYYDIGQCVNSAVTRIVDYTLSGAINTGVGASNTISVTYTSGTNTMAVFINGSQVNSFQPNTGSNPYIPNWTGGKAGFMSLVGNSSEEGFPYTASDVRFKFVSPVVYP
jgi:hypothetical protein